MVIGHNCPEIAPTLSRRLCTAFLRCNRLLVFRVNAAEKIISSSPMIIYKFVCFGNLFIVGPKPSGRKIEMIPVVARFLPVI